MDWFPIFLDATRQELGRADTGTVLDREGWLQVTWPQAKVVWRNMVHHAVMPDEEADTRIAEVKAAYEALDLPFLWRTTPACRPTDLAKRLQAHGLAHFETLHCLKAHASDFPPPDPAGATLEVVTADTVKEYVTTAGNGWNMPLAGQERMRALLELELARGDAPGEERQQAWLARIDGEPVGTCSMSFFPQSSHLTGGSVPPHLRGKGIYQQMVLHRMQVLRERGRDLVTMHAVSNTSSPICKRMGFEQVLRLDSWCWPPEEAQRWS